MSEIMANAQAADLEDVETKYVPDVLVSGKKTLADVNQDVSAPLERFPTGKWWACFVVALCCFGVGAALAGEMFVKGLGVLGLNQPNGWGVFIVNFVFWVGIGHAGTLISAILFLFRQ